MQQLPGGICFAHGPYTEMQCPKWPACITDPQKDEYKSLKLAPNLAATLRSILRQLREKRRDWLKQAQGMELAITQLDESSTAACQVRSAVACCRIDADALLPIISEIEEVIERG